MKSTQLIVILLSFALNITNSASAETEKISIEKLIAEGIQENRDLRAINLIIEEAKGKLIQSGLWPNPELQTGKTNDRLFNNDGEFSASIAFIQKFPIASRITKGKELSRLDIKLAEAEVRNAKRIFIGEISKSGFELYVLQEKEKSINKLKSAYKKLIQISQDRFKHAEVSITDLNTEKLELIKLESLAASIDVQKIQKSEELRRFIGGDILRVFNIETPTDESFSTEDLTTLINQSIKDRPDWELVALGINRANAEEALARAEAWEDWSIGLEYSRDKQVLAQPVGVDQGSFLGARLSVPLPFWNKNEGKIAEAKATKQKKSYELESLELKIREEIISSLSEVKRLKPIIEQYKTKSIPLAEENLTLLQTSYQQGLSSFPTLIQGGQQLLDLNNAYLQVLGAFLNAKTQFELATARSLHKTITKENTGDSKK